MMVSPGPLSSRRMKMARMPATRKTAASEMQYRMPIRLWSFVDSQDQRPVSWLR